MKKFRIETENTQMEQNVEEFASAVIGHRIISAVHAEVRKDRWGYAYKDTLVLTLSNGNRVKIIDSSECCAYTQLDAFMLNPESVNHVITSVGTSDGYTTWHIYAEMNDVLNLTVGWAEGTGYYSYGFDIKVIEMEGVSF
jgi:hypothetical protein